MSKYDKLLSKLRNNPKNVDFKILKKLPKLQGFGKLSFDNDVKKC